VITLTLLYFDYSEDPGIINTSKGRYIIHSSNALSSLNMKKEYSFSLSSQMVDWDVYNWGSHKYLGFTDKSYNNILSITISDDKDTTGKTTPAVIPFVYDENTSTSSRIGSWIAISDTDWHKLEFYTSQEYIYFLIDDVIMCSTNTIPSLEDTWFTVRGCTASYCQYDIDEWDNVNENVHFKIRRSDSSEFNDWRWDDLKISDYHNNKTLPTLFLGDGNLSFIKSKSIMSLYKED